MIDDEPAFELGFSCGTCPLLFRRLEGSKETLSLQSVQDRLASALYDPDECGVIDAFARLLPADSARLPALRAHPRSARAAGT
ncbi:hypothetical protein ACIGD1_18750 [Streptomyces sp. NPDC085612]|uniref:hypothetical protein n=1 Tax=Streptomyces sp. NPDC085612 TaxID=3365732 RepID=UPI0037CD63F9